MIMPGVQNPHCSPWCALKAACTGYHNIVKSILAAAEEMGGRQLKAAE